MDAELNDKFQIFELAYKFTDAANRKDGKMFQSLWAEDEATFLKSLLLESPNCFSC